MQRAGYGGQAAACRGEPNAVGIPTKWSPRTTANAYFDDGALEDPVVTRAVEVALNKLEWALMQGRVVVLPRDGIGTGRAELPQRAPRLFAYLKERLDRLSQIQPVLVD